MSAPQFEVLGDDALLVRLGERIDADTNLRVHRLAARLRNLAPRWLRDLVPAYASLALHVDPDALAPFDDPVEVARHWLHHRLAGDASEPACDAVARTLEIAVEYGGDAGPDLEDVAAHAGLRPSEVIARHSGGSYRVAMLGFAPGFPYLLGLEPALAMPRLAQPRLQVPAGSVAIGGAQTGIYPRSGPGGWRIIGRTAARLFDPQREPATLLQPGDRVRFVAIDSAR